jgi:CRISPR-associated protein Cas2
LRIDAATALAVSSELPGAPPPSRIPLKERASIVFAEKGQLDVLDGADRRSGNAHMLVVVVNNAPPRLRGRHAVEQVKSLIGEGDAVVAWDATNDAGFSFETFGANRRVAVDFDGLQLVAFCPPPESGKSTRLVGGRLTLFEIVGNFSMLSERSPHARG